MRVTTLENGIRVASASLPNTRSVALGVLVDAGPRNEPTQKSGLAHLAEHLFFQGTSSRNAREIALFVDRSGGSIGAFTARDYTLFGASVLDDYLPFAIELMGDILLNSLFPQGALDREKQSILSELARAEDDPQSLVHDLLKSLAWGFHPLGRQIAGSPESVQLLTREDLIYFVGENYLPDRIIVAAAGNLDHEDFTAHIRDAFWRMIGTSHRSRLSESCGFKAGVVLREKPLHQVYFALGLPALPFAHPQRFHLHLLTRILGGGLSSRLYQLLRENLGLVYYIDAEYHAYRDHGMLVIEGSTTPDQFLSVLNLIGDMLRNLANGESQIDLEELHTARTRLQGQHLLESEQAHVQMSRLATQLLYFGKPIPEQSLLQEIAQISVQELNDFSHHFLTKNLSHLALSAVGPFSENALTQENMQAWISRVCQR